MTSVAVETDGGSTNRRIELREGQGGRPLRVPGDVVYRVHPSAMTVVTRSAAALKAGSERVMIRPYPPPTLAIVA